MRSVVLVATAVIAALLVSGCVDPVKTEQQQQNARRVGQGGQAFTPPIGPGWAEKVFAFEAPDGQDHNHKDYTHHQGLSTANFEVLGHDPLTTDYHGMSAGGYFCADVREGEEQRLSVVHSWVSDVAYVISDVTDPMNPKKIGEFVMANTHVYDLALTPDQDWVLLSTSPGTNNVGEDPLEDDEAKTYQRGDILFRDACSGETMIVDGPEQGLPFASGLILVDIRNPRAPVIEDFRHIPVTGGHSVRVETKDGEDLILISTTSGLPQVGNPTGHYFTAAYWFMNFIDAPDGSRVLNFLSHYWYPSKPSPVPQLQVPSSLHDGFLQKHPVTGTWLAYLAAGDSGLAILDITDPMMPELIGTWNDFKVFGDGAPTVPFVHEALPLDTTWDGKHYTWIGEECAPRPNGQRCLVAMLDTTDPSDIKFVGGWSLPIEFESTGATFSLHYLGIQNRTLFITAYHAGVWAIDLSTEESMRTMPSVGVFMPDRAPPKGTVYPNHVYHYTPIVMDALPLSDGTMIVYDGTGGLYMVRYDHNNPAPPPKPWPFPFNQ